MSITYLVIPLAITILFPLIILIGLVLFDYIFLQLLFKTN